MSAYADLQRSESIKAAGAYVNYVERLYVFFNEFNVLHFDGQLEYPALEIRPFDKPNGGSEFLGFCEPATCHLLNGKIGIDARTITFCGLPDKYTHAKNVFLHETVHLYSLQLVNWCQKTTDQNWHGFYFACQCNRIGAYYKWQKVRSSRKFGQKKCRRVLNCETWPHFCQNDPKAEADYFLMSRRLKASRLEARKLIACPSVERDASAVRTSFQRLLEKASTPELKAEVIELHRLLSIHEKVDFCLWEKK